MCGVLISQGLALVFGSRVCGLPDSDLENVRTLPGLRRRFEEEKDDLGTDETPLTMQLVPQCGDGRVRAFGNRWLRVRYEEILPLFREDLYILVKAGRTQKVLFGNARR